MKLLPFLIVAGLIISCGEAKKEESKTEQETNQAPASSETDSKKEARANISVTLTGGDIPGTYQAVCSDACCSYGIAGEKVFGNQYSETGKGAKELSSVQLWIDDVTGDKTTKEFLVTVAFGELFGKDSKSYTIDTRKGATKGSGTVDLKYSGGKASVEIKGTSQEGVQIDLKMQCNKVLTTENIMENLQ